ncbi:MAG: Gfo/Idh/MocA family oxidoreductase [Pirellulales bacterium]|nr:Gfo/Idh/MocA family oxidoreductase [Pirellulales bacterium]
MKRRDFLRKSAVAAAVGIAAPCVIPSGVLSAADRPGANDRVKLGIIGLGGRTHWMLTNEDFPGADIVAVADCFEPRCHEKAKLHPDGERWNKYQDYRTMLDREKLDAVFVETPTHARALICIHAMQAGLDVYAEKPVALTVAEGRTLVNAARKYDRVFQSGTQQRSMPRNIYASKLVRDGAIGKIHTVIACNFWGPGTWTPKLAQAIPKGLDWDHWCNQTPLQPYHKELQFGWSDWRTFDNGGQSWGVTGWGTHALDQVQCALGTDDTGPEEIWLETPGPHGKVTMRFASGTLLKLHGEKRGHEDLGAIFVGDKGKIEIKRGTFMSNPKELLRGAPDLTPRAPGESIPHIKNFIDCVRSREQTIADAEVGHRATTLCHLITICRDLGRKLRWDPTAEQFVGDDEANTMLSRSRRKGYELPDIVT